MQKVKDERGKRTNREKCAFLIMMVLLVLPCSTLLAQHDEEGVELGHGEEHMFVHPFLAHMGLPDAPALAQADVGIAIGAGTDVAAETADIILVNSNPEDISALILFGKATYKKMTQNLAWATGYNAFVIPLAAGVLYNAGIIITPAIGAVLMSLSTVLVAINAKLLKIK